MSSPSPEVTLAQWVDTWNELVFFHPDDQVSADTLSETVDPDIKVKINHDVHDINGLTGGVQYVRHTTTAVLKSNELLLSWNAPDGIGGCTVHKTVFANTDKASRKVVTKISLITTIVKASEGKRKVAELIEVEVEQ